MVLQKTVYTEIDFNIKSPEEKIIIDCDEKLLFQVFTNLVKNAVESIHQNIKNKKIQTGKLQIKVTTAFDKATVEFIDNGMGFDFKSNKNFFDPYITDKSEGTGLGLSIVKKIIEDHKGQITLQNNQNKNGADIKIIFPLSIL